MGVGVEAWRARVGSWNCRSAKGTRRTGGQGGLANLLILLLSFVVTFLGARLDTIPSRLKTYKWRARVVLDLKICVFLILLVVSALVAYKLVFDVETNPGPAMDHLIQPIPEVQRITGRSEDIVPAFTQGWILKC